MMALGIIRRWSWVPLVAGVVLAYGCSSSPATDDEGGCSKDTDCANGRICEKHTCIDDPNQGGVLGGSSGSNGSGASGGTMNGSGGTSVPANGGTGNASNGGSGGTSGSSGTANGGSTSGSSGAGAGGSSGTAGTAGTASGPCSEDDPASCPTTDSMTYCSEGALVTVACADFCGELGFPTGPCSAPSGCACDLANPTDETCVIATNAVCGCLMDSDTPCVDEPDDSDPDSIYYWPPFIYASCYSGVEEDQTFFHCIAEQAQMDPAPLCSDAFEACGVDVGGAAGAGG